MKKVLALTLALVMVVLAVAACGGQTDVTTDPATTTNGAETTNDQGTTAKPETPDNTKGTEATEATTKPEATTEITTQPPVVETPVQGVYYVPVDSTNAEIVALTGSFNGAGTDAINGIFKTLESTTATNIVDNSTVTLSNVTAGHLYLVETKGTEVTLCKDLGGAMKFAVINRFGKAGKWENAETKDGGPAKGNWAYYFDNITYMINHLDVDALNAAMADYTTSVGSFGTMTITKVTEDAVTATIGGKEVNAAELNVKFVYATYTGSAIKAATEEESLLGYGLKTSTVDVIAVAEDEANPDGQGATEKAWKGYNSTGSILNQDASYVAHKQAVPTWFLAFYGSDPDLADAAAERYEEFLGFYEEQVNCMLWGESVEDSALYAYWSDAEFNLAGDETMAPLSYTYYYDVATDTYIVFVTDNGKIGSLTYGDYLTHADFKAANPDLFN